MNLFLILAFLFFIGSVAGWGLELVFRRFFSKNNPDRHWINPGFCTGPYLPLYGSGLCVLYLLAAQEPYIAGLGPTGAKLCLFVCMALGMTALEFASGMYLLKVYRIRLWDYSEEWGNVEGVICPKFSLYWAILGAAYYLLVHPHILDALRWLSQNLAFSFFIGVFFGVFAVDVGHAAGIVARLKAFAEENNVVVRYETVKAHIRLRIEQKQARYRFFRPFHSDAALHEHLNELAEHFREIDRRIRERRGR